MTEDTPTDAPPKRIRFFYIKSRAFRVVHVDGAIGGITPRGLIHAAFYSERSAIPQETEHEIADTGRLGERTDQSGKEGIVREMDVDIIMSKRSATDLRDWLNDKLKELEEIEGQAKKEGSA